MNNDFLRTRNFINAKLYIADHWIVPSKVFFCLYGSAILDGSHPMTKSNIGPYGKTNFKIYLSEITEPFNRKPSWNVA